MADYKKPLPIPDMDSKEFWDGCHRHELLLQKCQKCHSFHYPPAPVCPTCFSSDLKWEKVSGKAEVYTFSIVRRAPNPDWEADMPYVVGVAQLDEGPRIVTNFIGCKPEDLKIGMKVQVSFEDATETVSLPKFKPV
jgi:uncharacterized OB-fold protein